MPAGYGVFWSGYAGCRKRASNDTSPLLVRYRRHDLGYGMSYGAKRRRNIKRGLTTGQVHLHMPATTNANVHSERACAIAKASDTGIT